MTEVYIKYNPYRLSTTIKINNNALSEESPVAQMIHGKRLQKWIGMLPEALRSERGDREFRVTFHGNALDYDDVKDAFEHAQRESIIGNYTTTFEEALGDNEVYNKLMVVYDDLMEDSYFTDSLSNSDKEGLEGAFKRVQDNVFPIHVIATMSSGKSTLINALLRKKLMPSKNEACTAIITEILDNDSTGYAATVYDRDDSQINSIPNLTYEDMNSLNDNENIAKVSIEGDVPFLNVTETKLKLVDTPGPNNARNTNHRETTYKNINSATENMILYILNYTQLATNDDENLLNYVAEEIRKGGKETRDRFLFVINKMDAVGEDDSVPHAIEITKNYLAKHGIDDPQIFPCSAFAALGLRSTETDFNKLKHPSAFDLQKEINKLAADPKYASNPALMGQKVAELAQQPEQNIKLTPAEKKLESIMDQLNEIDALHLEQYSTLTPSEQEKLRQKLADAKASNDYVEQALIHSGIYSIESAIRAYVQKYAKAKKIHDLVEPLEAQLHQCEKSTNAKLAALSGGKEAEEIKKRSEAVRSFIDKGNEAKEFKAQIDAINPIPEIEKNAKDLIDKANVQLTKTFKRLGEKIEGRQEAMRIINNFSDDAADVLSNLSAQMEIVIQKEVTETSTKLIKSYQQKLNDLDSSVGSSLDFGTSDLVNGILSRMKASAGEYSSSGKIGKQQEQEVDAIHEDVKEEYKEKVIKKVKEKRKVQDGLKKIKTGEERVVVGSHKVKVGSHQEQKSGIWNGIKGFFGAKSAFREVADYEWVDDVEYRPTYDYVPNMKEIVEEIPKEFEETRTRTKYVVDTDELRDKLTTPIRRNMNKDRDELIKESTKYINQLKKQFMNSFDEIDNLIKEKYAELEECTRQGDDLEKRKAECKQMAYFIQDNLKEIAEALNV